MMRSLWIGALICSFASFPTSFTFADVYWQPESESQFGTFLTEDATRSARSLVGPANQTPSDTSEPMSEDTLPEPSASSLGSGVDPSNIPSTITEPSDESAVEHRNVPYTVPSSGFTTLNFDSWRELANNSALFGTGHCHSHACSPDSPWFGGFYGLALQRDNNQAVNLSVPSSDSQQAVLSTSDADIQIGGGFEVRVGRYLSDCWAIEGVYWGIFPDSQTSSIDAATLESNLSSNLSFNGLNYNNGSVTDTVSSWFGDREGGAQYQSIRRSFSSNNVELNLIRNPLRRSAITHYELLIGARYLNLNDDLRYVSGATSSTPGDDPDNELAYEVDIQNHLVGAQVGGRMDHYFYPKLSGQLGAKFGIYGNYVRHQQTLQGGNGFATDSISGANYNLDHNDTDIAFLGELFAGLGYDLGPRWRISGGYRAVTACGVASSIGQIPLDQQFSNRDQAERIHASEYVLLHGVYIGTEYNW